MNREDALALAKRMFQRLARLSPRGVKYRETAAVLVDVLSYAGRESEAENLALATTGRYPHDLDRVRGASIGFRQPGDRVTPGYEPEVLQQEVAALRARLFGAERGSMKGPTKVRAPISAFQSNGGRVFTITDGERVRGTWGPESTWLIRFNGDLAGYLYRDSAYRAPLEWHASTSPLRIRNGTSRGGFDVAAFRSAEECLVAWSRSADEILDYRENVEEP